MHHVKLRHGVSSKCAGIELRPKIPVTLWRKEQTHDRSLEMLTFNTQKKVLWNSRLLQSAGT